MWKPFVETTSDEWKKRLDVNVLGLMYFTHEVLPNMIENAYGRIINLAATVYSVPYLYNTEEFLRGPCPSDSTMKALGNLLSLSEKKPYGRPGLKALVIGAGKPMAIPPRPASIMIRLLFSVKVEQAIFSPGQPADKPCPFLAGGGVKRPMQIPLQ